MIAVEADVFGGGWPLLSFPEKQPPHSFMCSAEEVLKSPQPFWAKLPHAARPPLARQSPADQHYLNNVNKIDALLGKASDATL